LSWSLDPWSPSTLDLHPRNTLQPSLLKAFSAVEVAQE
jgi:hypothetical protein